MPMIKPMDEIRDGQSLELLKELHILTRDGKINQDSRRKLKQVYHLFNFIEPLLKNLLQKDSHLTVVDHGAGKSYLGFIIYDLFFKSLNDHGHVFGIETRTDLIEKSIALQKKLEFKKMSFLNLSVADAITSTALPATIDMVTALHACDTATDDAIHFGIAKNAKYIVLIPCCQAEVAAALRKNKAQQLVSPWTEVWRHPIHTREFGSHITNVLRCLQLESYGYQVTVTELVGLEHSMKNEIIIATRHEKPKLRPAERLKFILSEMGLQELEFRFNTQILPTKPANKI